LISAFVRVQLRKREQLRVCGGACTPVPAGWPASAGHPRRQRDQRDDDADDDQVLEDLDRAEQTRRPISFVFEPACRRAARAVSARIDHAAGRLALGYRALPGPGGGDGLRAARLGEPKCDPGNDQGRREGWFYPSKKIFRDC